MIFEIEKFGKLLEFYTLEVNKFPKILQFWELTISKILQFRKLKNVYNFSQYGKPKFSSGNLVHKWLSEKSA